MSNEPLIKTHGIAFRGDRVCLDLWYPRSEPISKIEVGLVDVRAADGLLIEYDFDRDGWSIKQASTFSWDIDDQVCNPDWQEVAFVRAWAREKPETTPPQPAQQQTQAP